MTRTIHKYLIHDADCAVMIPKFARFLHFDFQHGTPKIWCLRGTLGQRITSPISAPLNTGTWSSISSPPIPPSNGALLMRSILIALALLAHSDPAEAQERRYTGSDHYRMPNGDPPVTICCRGESSHPKSLRRAPAPAPAPGNYPRYEIDPHYRHTRR